MKKKFTTLIAVLFVGVPLLAQKSKGNPFARLGYEVKIATLTDYNEEFHDSEDVVQIGQVWFDTKKKRVVGFVSEKENRFELVTDVISTSIDPHCEKYPWISPYAYCFNNPIRFIDPDGMDVWEMDEDGYIRWAEESDRHFLYALNSNGTRGDNFIEVKDRSILDQLELSRDDYMGGNYAITKGSEIGNVFTFVANNSQVEWGISKFNNGDYILTTSHDKTSVENVTKIKGYDEKDLIFKVHSHPGADDPRGASHTNAAGGDMRNIIKMANRFNAAGDYANFPKHFVYHRETKTLYQYTPYTPSINLGEVSKSTPLLYRIQNSKSPFYGY